jgi:aspartate dehydrogenase
MARIGLIGFGGIGQTVARLAGDKSEIAGVLIRPGRSAPVEAAGLPAFEDVDALLASRPDCIAECAGQPAVRDVGPAILAAGIDLIVISIGALADAELEAELREAATIGGAHILLPAGAIGGIDALAAMALEGLSQVTYRSRKPPAAWKGSPAVEVADLDSLAEATTLYQGTAREAASRFPKNANVAATVALAGLGLDETRVALVADPDAPGNVHEIEASGASGNFTIRLVGRPSPDNPRTSALTALSMARAVLNRDALIQI